MKKLLFILTLTHILSCNLEDDNSNIENKPIVIIHSISDTQIPFELGQNLFNSSNKSTTEFWKIDGEHINGMDGYEEIYVRKFMELIGK